MHAEVDTRPWRRRAPENASARAAGRGRPRWGHARENGAPAKRGARQLSTCTHACTCGVRDRRCRAAEKLTVTMTRRKRRRPGAPTLRKRPWKRPRTRRPSVHTARPGFCVLRPGGGGPGRATRPSAERGAQTLPPPGPAHARGARECRRGSAVAKPDTPNLRIFLARSLESLVTTSHKECLGN